MIDESGLRERFAQLRDEERAGVPRFALKPRKRRVAWRLVAATATLALIVMLAVPSRTTQFSDSDRAVVRSAAAWNPPTDFLLHTPGNEMLTTTPRIPDLKGIPQ